VTLTNVSGSINSFKIGDMNPEIRNFFDVTYIHVGPPGSAPRAAARSGQGGMIRFARTRQWTVNTSSTRSFTFTERGCDLEEMSWRGQPARVA